MTKFYKQNLKRQNREEKFHKQDMKSKKKSKVTKPQQQNCLMIRNLGDRQSREMFAHVT